MGCEGVRWSEGAGRVDAEQSLSRGILGRPLTAEAVAWCGWRLALALAVVGAVLWFLNRDLGGAVFVPHLLLVPGFASVGWWWPSGAGATGSAGCSWVWGRSRR